MTKKMMAAAILLFSGTVAVAEQLPAGWKETTTDGDRIKIMAATGEVYYFNRSSIRRDNRVTPTAQVVVETANARHLLRFFCDQGPGPLTFDDLTDVATLQRGGRNAPPGTVLGQIGAFACRH